MKKLLLWVLIGNAFVAQAMQSNKAIHRELLCHRDNMIALLKTAFVAIALVQAEVFNSSDSVEKQLREDFQRQLEDLGRRIESLEESRSIWRTSGPTGLAQALEALMAWKKQIHILLLNAGAGEEILTEPLLLDAWELLPAQKVFCQRLSRESAIGITSILRAIARADELGCTEKRSFCSIM